MPEEEKDGVLTPDDINDMSSEDFKKYIDELDTTNDNISDISEEPVEQETGYIEKTESDEDAEEPEEDNEPAEPEPTSAETQPFRSFSTEEEYNNDIQRRINEAVAKDRQTRESDENYRRMNELSRLYYGNSSDPMRDMADEMERQAAERDGVDMQELRNRMNTERDAQKYRELMEMQQRQRAAQQNAMGMMNRDVQQLKILYPDFDMNAMMKDPTFRTAITSGGKSIAQAYKDVLDARAAQQAKEERPRRKPIAQNAQSAQRGTGEASLNPAKMSSEDFMRYINNIKEA